MSRDDINCHYVSESLTRLWEGKGHELHFYDFSTKEIECLPSKKLFARRGLNTPTVERWLSDVIEAPLGRFRKVLRKRIGPVPAEVDDLAAHRALLLLLPLQVARMAEVKWGPGQLDQICKWTPQKLDRIVGTIRSTYSLIIVQGHPRLPFYFTEHGFFMLPFPGASIEHAAATAMPLNEWEAVVALPRSMNRDVVSRTLTQGEGAYINNCSVGTNANRVVIHPGVIDAMDEVLLIAEIEAARSRTRDCYRTSLQAMNVISDAIARVGDRIT